MSCLFAYCMHNLLLSLVQINQHMVHDCAISEFKREPKIVFNPDSSQMGQENVQDFETPLFWKKVGNLFHN